MAKSKKSDSTNTSERSGSTKMNNIAEAQTRSEYHKGDTKAGDLVPDVNGESTTKKPEDEKAPGSKTADKKLEGAENCNSDKMASSDPNAGPQLDKKGKKRVAPKSPRNTTPSKKRKLTNSGHVGSRNIQDNGGAPMDEKQVKKRKSATKTKGKNRVIGSESSPPVSLPPTVLSPPLAAKVKQALEFTPRIDGKDTVLERDVENDALITVPVSLLLGAIMTMRLHYEVGSQSDASLSDVDEAITNQFSRPFGERTVDFVTLDASKITEFVSRIHEKLARHGLDGVNLLELELEMLKHDQLKAAGVSRGWREPRDGESAFDPNKFEERFQRIWNNVIAVKHNDEGLSNAAGKFSDDSLSNAAGEFRDLVQDEVEVGRTGVCAAPIKDV